jgi:iron(III) transport system permease protein
MAYSYRLLKLPKFWIYASKVSLLGYALPGAVTAIGIIATLLLWNSNLAFLGVFGLLFGYQVRFFAVGFQAVDSGFKKVPQAVDDAALTLGSGPLKNLFRIHIPLLRTSLLSGFILTFVDVTKELPITLILRPFNFETLATNAFQYATDEMAPASAAASLFIIFVGLVPVYLLNKWLSNR